MKIPTEKLSMKIIGQSPLNRECPSAAACYFASNTPVMEVLENVRVVAWSAKVLNYRVNVCAGRCLLYSKLPLFWLSWSAVCQVTFRFFAEERIVEEPDAQPSTEGMSHFITKLDISDTWRDEHVFRRVHIIGPREVVGPVEFNHAIGFVNKVKVYYHNYNQYHYYHQKCMH